MKRGRKGYAEIRPLVVFLAQKIRAERLMASRHRSLREIAFLLAKAGHGTRGNASDHGPRNIRRYSRPYGPSAVQKMLATKLSLNRDDTYRFERLWERRRPEILIGKRIGTTDFRR